MAVFSDITDTLDTIQASVNALRAVVDEVNASGHFNDDRNDVVKIEVVVARLNSLTMAIRATTDSIRDYRV